MEHKTDDEILAALDAALAPDLLEDTLSSSEVAQMLVGAGGDPDEIGRRGNRNALVGIVSQILAQEPGPSGRGARPKLRKASWSPAFASRFGKDVEPGKMSDEELAALVEALTKTKG